MREREIVAKILIDYADHLRINKIMFIGTYVNVFDCRLDVHTDICGGIEVLLEDIVDDGRGGLRELGGIENDVLGEALG